MGLFDLLEGSNWPSQENLSWLTGEYDCQITKTLEYNYPVVEINITDEHSARILYNKYVSGGKSRHTYYFTYFVAPLPASLLQFWVMPKGCSFLSSKKDLDFGNYSVEYTPFSSTDPIREFLDWDTQSLIKKAKLDILEIQANFFATQREKLLVKEELLLPFIEINLQLLKHAMNVKQSTQLELNNVLLEITNPWGGKMVSDTFAKSFIINFEGTPAHLALSPEIKTRCNHLPVLEEERLEIKPSTQFQALVNPSGNLKLVPQTMWHIFPKLFGLQDIKIGYPEFDRRYMIKSASENFARDFLNTAIRDHIEMIHNLGNGSLKFDISQNSLSMIKDCFLYKKEDLSEFLTSCFFILDKLKPAEIKPAEERPEIIHCQVCGLTAVEDAIECPNCHKVQHKQCWQYLGKCSTFGCKQQGLPVNL